MIFSRDTDSCFFAIQTVIYPLIPRYIYKPIHSLKSLSQFPVLEQFVTGYCILCICSIFNIVSSFMQFSYIHLTLLTCRNCKGTLFLTKYERGVLCGDDWPIRLLRCLVSVDFLAVTYFVLYGVETPFGYIEELDGGNF